MILYLDTSAIVKKYFAEQGSKTVVSLWKNSEAVASSFVAYSETLCAIYRKQRESAVTLDVDFSKIIADFEKDWKKFIKIAVNDSLNKIIGKIARNHRLRGFDAIHLASALILKSNIDSNILFACHDNLLLQSAIREGLSVPDLNSTDT